MSLTLPPPKWVRYSTGIIMESPCNKSREGLVSVFNERGRWRKRENEREREREGKEERRGRGRERGRGRGREAPVTLFIK